MKALRYLLYAAAAVVVLAIAAAVTVSMLFDPNSFKPEIESMVKASTGRTLKLEGKLGLAFFPSIGVSVGKATLSEHASEKPFASLESARIAVAVMPLLHRQMVVNQVALSGLNASIVRHKDGSTNVDDLLAPGPAGGAAHAGGGAGNLTLDVSGIRIEHSSIAYRDERSGRELAISDLDLRTGRLADDTPGSLRLAATVTGKQPHIAVKIEAAGDYRFSLKNRSFSLSSLDVKASGDAADVKGLVLEAKGALAAEPSKGAFSATGLHVEAKGSSGGEAFNASVAAPRVAVESDKAEGEAVTAEVAITGAQRSATAKLKLAGVRGSAKALSVSKVDATFDAKTGETSVSGSASSPLRADLERRIFDLPGLAATIVASSPKLPQKTVKIPLSGSVHADLGKEQLATDLKAKFDDSDVRARLSAAGFAAPRYAFDIDVDRLDIDRYFPPAPAQSPQAADTAVDLSALKGPDASGSIAVGALTVHRLKLANVKVRVRLENGRLDLSPNSANLYGGSLAGSLAADAKGNQVHVKENLENVSVGPLLSDLTGRNALEGRGNVSLDVTAAGATVNAMKKSLAGSARIALRDGAIRGINLAESFRKAKAAIGSKSAQQQAADKSQKTDFSELKGSFVIRNGVAHNDDLDARSPFLRLGGSGDVNIGASLLDYRAKVSVVATAKGQGGADLAQLAGLTIPVRLVGPFDGPKYEIDYGAVVAGAVKSRVVEKLSERLKGKAGASAPAPGASQEDKLKSKLRGLFNR